MEVFFGLTPEPELLEPLFGFGETVLLLLLLPVELALGVVML